MNATNATLHDAGIRKAAILVASLDPAAADLLLDQLGPQQAALVREAVMALDELDDLERQRIIDDFRRIGPMVPSQAPGGIDLDGPMAAQLAPHNSNEQDCSISEDAGLDISLAPEPSSPFDFLRQADDERLSRLLKTERPQTIALVLSHLPPERAGEVMSRFTPALTADVVHRLVDLENTDPESLRHVEQALEIRLSQQTALRRERVGGPDTVTRILEACDRSVAGGILDNIAQYDEALAEQLGHQPITFDDLAAFDDATLWAVFQAAEPIVAETAMVGAAPELVEKLLSGMRAEDSQMLRRKLECPGPIRLSDVEEARRQIAALAQRMSRPTAGKAPLAA